MVIHSGTTTLIIMGGHRVPPRPVASAECHQRVTAGLAQAERGGSAGRWFEPWSSGRDALGGGWRVIRHCSFKREIAFLSNNKKRFIFL